MSAEHLDGLSEEAAEALSEQYRPSWEAPDPWATGDEGPTMAEEGAAEAASNEAASAEAVLAARKAESPEPSCPESGGDS